MTNKNLLKIHDSRYGCYIRHVTLLNYSLTWVGSTKLPKQFIVLVISRAFFFVYGKKVKRVRNQDPVKESITFAIQEITTGNK